MPFKNGELAVQELGSHGYKDRDDADMAKYGRKQTFEVSWLALCSRHD